MNVDPQTFLAIAAMGGVTVATRLAGLFLPAGFATRGRLAAAFAALPVAVLTALIAPTVLATGWAERLAALAVVLAAMRLPMIAVVAIGIAAAAACRAVLG